MEIQPWTLKLNDFGPIVTALDLVPIDPNDDEDLETPIRGIYVGGNGNLMVDTYAGREQVPILAVSAGVQYSFAIRRVRATGTTATGLLGIL